MVLSAHWGAGGCAGQLASVIGRFRLWYLMGGAFSDSGVAV